MDLSRSEPIDVTVYRAGRPIATVTCNRRRPDVAAAGYSSDICGFNLELREPVGYPEELAVCFADSPVQLTATGAARKSQT